MSFIAALSVFVTVMATPALCADMEHRAEHDESAREFHAAQSEAEKSLDAILKLADAVPESSWVAVQAPWRSKARDRLFESLFSPALQAAWVKAEQDAVQKNCNGAYIKGELCGIDIHPITCSQDVATRYHYRTVQASPEQANIDYRWEDVGQTIATFRLIRVDHSWVLDGVACAGYLKFNMR